MGKYGVGDVLRAIFCGFFALVGLAALLFFGFHELTEAPKYIEKAIFYLCLGGIF